MNDAEKEEPFYVGYLPRAPAYTAKFVRRVIGGLGIVALVGGGLLAMALPYFGTGEFEFGHPREFSGTLQCDAAAPRLRSKEGDALLVGFGKHGVPAEICGLKDRSVLVRGTLIHRDGRKLIEVERWNEMTATAPVAPRSDLLGRFTLTGEIVDSKCYFGVMNPGEGRVHRACADLCLRGGVPAVFVARDRAGNVIPLLIAGRERGAIDVRLLPWVGQAVQISGDIERRGQWLTIIPEIKSVRFAVR